MSRPTHNAHAAAFLRRIRTSPRPLMVNLRLGCTALRQSASQTRAGHSIGLKTREIRCLSHAFRPRLRRSATLFRTAWRERWCPFPTSPRTPIGHGALTAGVLTLRHPRAPREGVSPPRDPTTTRSSRIQAMPICRSTLLALAVGSALAAASTFAQTMPPPAPMPAAPVQVAPPARPPAPPAPPRPVAPPMPPSAATALAPPPLPPPPDQRLQQQQRTLHQRVQSMSQRPSDEQRLPVSRSAEDTRLYPAPSTSN
jgi:hypothetical protein